MLAVVSILNRAAGVALSGVLVLFVAWLVALASGPEVFGLVNGFAGSLLGKAMMVAAAFGLGWHAANGVRHLFWDAGKGFSIPAAESSAWLVILFALAVGAAAAFLLFVGGF
jgi:succinate dehydrogenase / fumarate reductase cytochrome b subunit